MAEDLKRVSLMDPDLEIRTKPGEVYIFTTDVSTRAINPVTGRNIVYSAGATISVIRHTREAPHGDIGPNGYNVEAETIYGKSIWSTFESCIERKLLRLWKETPLFSDDVSARALDPLPPDGRPSVWERLMSDE